MATGPVVNQGKGEFLREFLASHRDAKLEDVAAAWTADGHSDGISESLINKIRSELGLTGKRGSNGRATEDAESKKAQPSQNKSKGKRKKSAESPLSPDVREDAKGPNKSAFVGEMLGHEPEANMKAINEAWASAGNEGTISPSIYYKIKRELGVTGEPTAVETSNDASETEPSPSGDNASPAVSKPKAAKSGKATIPVKPSTPHTNGEHPSPVTSPAVAHPAGSHGRELHEIEGEIDELMYRLKGLGSFAEVQEALRAARRLLVRSHEH